MGRFEDDLNHILAGKRPTRDAFRDLRDQPQTAPGGGDAAFVPRAGRPPTLKQVANNIYDAPETIEEIAGIGHIDPETLKVRQYTEEHAFTDGRRKTVITDTKQILTAENRVAILKQVEGLCTVCNKFALKLFNCAVPTCQRPCCLNHSIVVTQDPANKHEEIRVCIPCFEQMQFAKDTWAEYDARRRHT